MLQNLFLDIIRVSLTTSAVIAVLLFLFPFIHKRYTAKWCCMVWLLFAVRLLIPFNPSLPKTPIEITSTSQNIEFQVPAQKKINSSSPAEQKIEREVKTTSHGALESSELHTVTWNEILSFAWALGIVLFMLYHLLGYFIFKKSVLRFAKTVEDQHTLKLWSEVKQEMKIKKSIHLLVCKKVQSPMMTGFFRPLLFLPDLDYQDSDLKMILQHELIHFKRRDIWYKLLILCANAVHWFNPFIYFMSAASNKDVEMACDSELVSDSDSAFRKQYSETILLAIRKGNQRQTAFSTYFYGGKKIMKERFINIFDMHKKRKGIIALCAILIIIGMAGSSVAWGVDDGKKGEEIDNIALLSAGNSYDLINGEFIISYGTKQSAVVPLTPDTNDQSAYFKDKAVYISDEVTAVAYGDNENSESPVSVMVSKDRGKTWSNYSVANTRAEDYEQKYIGFTTQNNGWLVLAGDVTSGHQDNRIFQTSDSGKTWDEIGNTNQTYARVVTGAGFTKDNIGFVSFRYDTDKNPVVYRTEDKGNTWEKCSLKIPDSFQSITTYATAKSPVFNGAKGVLPVTFRNQNWDGDPLDVTVQYETSDYGKTWTFNDKYNLALIWADAWSTRDGRGRYEIMNRKMQSEFRTEQCSPDDPNTIYYNIRWSSPWVVSYNVVMDGDQAVITYLYMDSTTSTYKGVERLSFGEEDRRAVVTSCKTEVDMEEYVDTSDWKTIDTGLYTFSMPSTWDAQVSADGTVNFFLENEEQLGTLSALQYDASKPISQFEGNHAEILNTVTLENCKYPATEVIIHRSESATADNNSNLGEDHIYLIPKNSKYAYDLCFESDLVWQKAIEIAKSMEAHTDYVQVQNVANQWARAVESRDGKAQYNLMSQGLQKTVYQDYQERHWVTGQSSPWVDGYTVKPGNKKAVVTYAYLTSEGFAGYYKQTLSFTEENDQIVVSSFTEPKQPDGLSDGIVIGCLEDQKTYLSAACLKDGMFSNITLSIAGKTKHFLWETCSKPSFLPDLSYADVDGDGQDELIVTLCKGEGTGVLNEEIHVMNPDDFSEITVQDPLAAMKNRVVTKVEESGVDITIDKQNPLRFSEKEIESEVAEKKSWFTDLGIGSVIDYSTRGNEITVKVAAQISPAGFLGDFDLAYEYKDHQLKVSDIYFNPDF